MPRWKRVPMPNHEAFVELVIECMDEATTAELLQIPGVWEAVSEYYNNEALALWEQRWRANHATTT